MHVRYSIGQIWQSSFVANLAAGANNLAAGYGAGLESLSSSLQVRNVLFARNRGYRTTSDAVSPQGNGAYVDGGSVAFESCTFVTNFGWSYTNANFMGEALRTTNSAVVAVTNSIFWGHSADIVGPVVGLTYCDLQSGLSNGVNGNISADPQFVSSVNNDFRLLKSSPCMNAGTNLSWMAGGVDLAGNPRITERFVDIGVYEGKTVGMIMLIQ
jgi:hypothetical protein